MAHVEIDVDFSNAQLACSSDFDTIRNEAIKMIKLIASKFSERARLKRAEIFKSALKPQEIDQILDLGGGSGQHFAQICEYRRNVTIADYNRCDLETASARYGFNTYYLDGSERLDIRDAAYDVVFCSSVIEHVTGPRDVVLQIRDSSEFANIAWTHQLQFAAEIRRISRRYFVQTPHRRFVIESHSWMPGIIVALPRSAQITILKWASRFWPKKTDPNWNLLTPKQMQILFPDAEIVLEKKFGLIKSVIALRR
jgi:SAM-dependent methyltransferase